MGCEGYFDAKPDISLVVPQTLGDFQAILDAEPRGLNSSPSVGLLSSDDLILGQAILDRLTYSQVSSYFWRDEFYLPGEDDSNWYTAYRKVFHANLVLDGLKDYSPKNKAEQKELEILAASAKFYRAVGHFEALSYFAEVFKPEDPNQLGIPVRLTSDLNQKIKRSTQVQTYEQIIQDLQDGIGVLPLKPAVLTRPSTWAAHSMLSRVLLYKQDYEGALMHAEEALKIDATLMDYSELDSTLSYSFEIFNPEVIHYGELLSGRYATNTATFVNPEIVRIYQEGDLRPFFFFKESQVDSLKNFRGNYTGAYYIFGGLAVDEVVLNKAEAAARLGDSDKALEAMDLLIRNRVLAEYLPSWIGIQQDELFDLIKAERRKELVFRGTRWLDLKRYNLHTDEAITISRKYNEEGVQLEPLDKKYVIPIPPMEMELNPLQQNPR